MAPFDLTTLRDQGWVVLSRAAGEQPEQVLLAMARQLGEPVPSRAGRQLVDRLTPIPSSRSYPRSLSRMFGTSAFPLHTDTAHWPIPARFLLLACLKPGSGGCPTVLLRADVLAVDAEEPGRLCESV